MNKSYEIKEVYSVYTTTDEYGRRGRLVGHFSDKTEADNQAQGQGWYGGKGDVVKIYSITIDGNTFALQSKETIKLNEIYGDEYYKKQNALAKLTDEEKKLLGLE